MDGSSRRFLRRGAQLHHVQIDGPADGDAVIFANSLGTDLRIWDEVVGSQTGGPRVIRYDMRGHGLTPAVPPPYSIADLAADLEHVIDALELRRVTICGVSVGGQVALQVAHDRPGLVQGLILCDTSFRIGAAEMWNQRSAAGTAHGMTAISRRSSRDGFQTSSDRTSGRGGRYRYMLEQCTVACRVCAALRDADLESLARGLRCPTLVLCGDQDQATPPAVNKTLAAAIPGAHYQGIPGAGHLPCIEQPAIVAAHVTSFMGKHAHV
jgi:3-oxoadipate enol-lactonase